MGTIDSEKAIGLLDQGEIVALPTETVYGLAAAIDDDEALKKVFSQKDRPFFDPLIVHVASRDHAKRLADWDELSWHLADVFWPGPLTLVLPKTDKVSPLITASGETVALRNPNHPVFLDILEKLNRPLAAPSANHFGHTSPTTAAHVLAEFRSEVPVVDGGPCQIGIESSVVQVTRDEEAWEVSILRPGMVSENDLAKACEAFDGPVTIQRKVQKNSPGHMKNHYQPSVPLALVADSLEWSKELNEKAYEFFDSAPVEPTFWELDEDVTIAARQLYSDLRKFSGDPTTTMVVLRIKKEWFADDHWLSLLDRLEKACHLWIKADDSGEFQFNPKT